MWVTRAQALKRFKRGPYMGRRYTSLGSTSNRSTAAPIIEGSEIARTVTPSGTFTRANQRPDPKRLGTGQPRRVA